MLELDGGVAGIGPAKGSHLGIERRKMLQELDGGQILVGVRFRVPLFVAQFLEGVEKEIAGAGNHGGSRGGDGICAEEKDQAAKDVIDGRAGAEIANAEEE